MKKKSDLFDFTSFFAWTFSNFLARCLIRKKNQCLIRDENDLAKEEEERSNIQHMVIDFFLLPPEQSPALEVL